MSPPRERDERASGWLGWRRGGCCPLWQPWSPLQPRDEELKLWPLTCGPTVGVGTAPEQLTQGAEGLPGHAHGPGCSGVLLSGCLAHLLVQRPSPWARGFLGACSWAPAPALPLSTGGRSPECASSGKVSMVPHGPEGLGRGRGARGSFLHRKGTGGNPLQTRPPWSGTGGHGPALEVSAFEVAAGDSEDGCLSGQFYWTTATLWRKELKYLGTATQPAGLGRAARAAMWPAEPAREEAPSVPVPMVEGGAGAPG